MSTPAPTTAVPKVFERVFKALHYRDFRLMFTGACISSVGTWMQNLAQAWLVLEISKSPFFLGLDAFLAGIPIFFFSLIGGVVADRVERRKVLLISQYIQMGSAFLLTLLILLKAVHIWEILCLSFTVGLAQSFGGPAYSALLPTLVNKEDIPNAIAMNSIQFNVARVLGPAIGGLALDRLGAVWCFGLNGISFLAPIVSLTVLNTRFLPEKTTESMLASMKQGFRFIRHHGAMEGLVVLGFLVTALGIPMTTFLPVFAKDIFHGGPRTFTLFLCASGGGAVVGGLGVAFLGNIRNKGKMALAMLALSGASISGFALSKSELFSSVLLFIGGVSLMMVFTNIFSLVQMTTANEMRGRVVSVYNTAFRGGMPMGNLVTGWLVPMFTAPMVLAVNGVLLLLLGLYFLFVERKVAAL